MFSFERNDIVDITLVSNLTEGMYIAAGTPVLELHSMSDSARQKMLQSRVERLQQQLELSQQGELQAKVQEAQASLALAHTNVLSYLPILQQHRPNPPHQEQRQQRQLNPEQQEQQAQAKVQVKVLEKQQPQ